MINPYKNATKLNPFKGDLHFHSSISDGQSSPEEMYDRLIELKFDFCCLADHDIPVAKTSRYDNLLILPGQELSADSGHIVSLFSQINRNTNWTTKEQLEAIRNSNGFSILSHPKIREFVASQNPTYTTKRLLCEFPELYDGIEIYTHNVGSGFKLAIDRLDAIWSAYIFTWGALHNNSFSPVWAFASSDGHHADHITENVGIIVWAESGSEKDIYAALETGSFYSLANSRARFSEITENDMVFHVSAQNAAMLRVIRAGGLVAEMKCIPSGEAGQISYSSDGTEGYLRFEAFDTDGRAIYSNPIFIGKNNA